MSPNENFWFLDLLRLLLTQSWPNTMLNFKISGGGNSGWGGKSHAPPPLYETLTVLFTAPDFESSRKVYYTHRNSANAAHFHGKNRCDPWIVVLYKTVHCGTAIKMWRTWWEKSGTNGAAFSSAAATLACCILFDVYHTYIHTYIHTYVHL